MFLSLLSFTLSISGDVSATMKKLIESTLTLPYGSVDCERAFSLVMISLTFTLEFCLVLCLVLLFPDLEKFLVSC